MYLIVRVKGGPRSGNWGHSGRPGREGGSLTGKGGGRVPLPGGGSSAKRSGAKKIPPVPKLSKTTIKSGSIPDHFKGDGTGQQAYNSWKRSQGGLVNVADDVRMRSWFTKRASAMEFNLDIPTAVPGQRDELSEEADEEKKKKPEEKPKKGKGGVKKPKKGAAKKKPKGGGGGKKPKEPKEKKGPTDEEKEKVAKSVGLSKQDYGLLLSAQAKLKAGDKLDDATAARLTKLGLLEKDGTMPSFALSLMAAIAKGDGIKARAVLKRESVRRTRERIRKAATTARDVAKKKREQERAATQTRREQERKKREEERAKPSSLRKIEKAGFTIPKGRSLVDVFNPPASFDKMSEWRKRIRDAGHGDFLDVISKLSSIDKKILLRFLSGKKSFVCVVKVI